MLMAYYLNEVAKLESPANYKTMLVGTGYTRIFECTCNIDEKPRAGEVILCRGCRFGTYGRIILGGMMVNESVERSE